MSTERYLVQDTSTAVLKLLQILSQRLSTQSESDEPPWIDAQQVCGLIEATQAQNPGALYLGTNGPTVQIEPRLLSDLKTLEREGFVRRRAGNEVSLTAFGNLLAANFRLPWPVP